MTPYSYLLAGLAILAVAALGRFFGRINGGMALLFFGLGGLFVAGAGVIWYGQADQHAKPPQSLQDEGNRAVARQGG